MPDVRPLLPALLAACTGGGGPERTPADEAAPTAAGAPARATPPGTATAPAGPTPPPGTAGAPAGPPLSGAPLQDPTGFPVFHSWPAPPGPRPAPAEGWSAPVRLSVEPGGGYRPQVVVAPDGTLHVVYYERDPTGDLLRHRTAPADRATDAAAWSAPAPLGFSRGRNWGPDLVARADGSVVVTFDHSDDGLHARGWITTWRDGRWSEPEPVTPDDGGEVGSVHVADGSGDELAVVWIGRPLEPGAHFRARGRWFRGGAWGPVVDLSDGATDAWHTNVERRADGSVLVGFDLGVGGGETRLQVLEGRDGAFGPAEDLTATGRPGERPHFAFGAEDHVTWFHKVGGRPLHVYVRSGRPGAWGPVEEPSAGLGGFQFDPEIAIAPDGTLCVVWGWDAGDEAELLYALRPPGGAWTPPRRVAEIRWGKPGLPSLVADAEGRFHVVWNQGVRGRNHVYYARLELP